MLLLEKLGAFVGNPKLFYMIDDKFWEAYSKLYFEYHEDLVDTFKKINKQEAYLEKI